jgi:branched-chain amino acid transport system permease protein
MTETQILLEGFLQALAAGLLVGAIYGLMCVGLAMIFGIMRVINFAQGDFMMLGMYVAFFVLVGLGVNNLFGATIGPYVAILLAAPVLLLFGYLIHRSTACSSRASRAHARRGSKARATTPSSS